MTTSKPKILVAFDFSDSSELALQHALNLSLEAVEREFHFIVAFDPERGPERRPREVIDYRYTKEVQALATKHITNAISKLNLGGEISMLVHVRIGNAGNEILSIAEEIGASLILLGSHGPKGGDRALLGSVSERVVREALCPVLVIRERRYEEIGRSKICEVSNDEAKHVAPHRYHHSSTVPPRPASWVLY